MALVSEQSASLKDESVVVIRSAQIEDAAQLLDIVLETAREGDSIITCTDEFPASVELEQEWIRSYASDPGKLLLVVTTENAVLGLLSFETGRRRRVAHRGELHLSVRHTHRNLGVGRILLERLIAWAAENTNLEKLTLSVFADNHRAIALYRKMGFVEEGRSLRSIKLGPRAYADEILMARFVR